MKLSKKILNKRAKELKPFISSIRNYDELISKEEIEYQKEFKEIRESAVQSEIEKIKTEAKIEAKSEEENKMFELIGSIQRNEIKLSYSSLKKFYETPRSFIKYKLKKFQPTPSMIFGSLLDCLILTPENFEKEFTILDTKPSTDNQLNFVSDFLEYIDGGMSEQQAKENAFSNNYKRGDADKTFDSLSLYIDALINKKMVISSNEKEKADKIVSSVLSNPTVLSMLEQAETIQEKLEWQYKGRNFVGFMDVRGPNFIMDLKYRGQSADVEQFQWDFKKLHYDLQGAMYYKACEILDLVQNPDYFIMTYDNDGNVSIIKVDFSYILFGMHKYDYCIQEFDKCTKSNNWSASFDFYGNEKGFHTLIRPKFATLKGSLDE